MGKLLSGCLMAIGAIVVLFVIVAILVSGRSSGPTPGSSVPASDQSVQQPVQQPAFSVTRGNTTYYGTIASDVGVAILGLRDAGPYLSSSFGELLKADGKFIIVGVAISNRQNTAITVNEDLFEILDSSGNVYSASEKSIEIETGNDLFLAQINPGVTKAGLVVFDVPQALAVDNLRLRFRGGMTGDSAILPLKLNSVEQPAAAPSIPIAPSAAVSQQNGDGQPNDPRPAVQQPPTADSPQATTSTTVSIGQTPEEVEAILGPPASITTGANHLYKYPHLIVVFAGGKVSEVHQIP